MKKTFCVFIDFYSISLTQDSYSAKIEAARYTCVIVQESATMCTQPANNMQRL